MKERIVHLWVPEKSYTACGVPQKRILCAEAAIFRDYVEMHSEYEERDGVLVSRYNGSVIFATWHTIPCLECQKSLHWMLGNKDVES